MYLVPMKAAIDIMELTADNKLTTNVALSPSQAYSSSAIGVSNLLHNIVNNSYGTACV